MDLFPDLKQTCIILVKILPDLNDSQRKEMRKLLLKLTGDLMDSMVVAEQYLRGVERSSIESDMLDQMYL